MRELALERCGVLLGEFGLRVLIAGNFNTFLQEKLEFSALSVTELCSVAYMCYVATNIRQIIENMVPFL